MHTPKKMGVSPWHVTAYMGHIMTQLPSAEVLLRFKWVRSRSSSEIQYQEYPLSPRPQLRMGWDWDGTDVVLPAARFFMELSVSGSSLKAGWLIREEPIS